ncbi:CBS domain-containing protein [Candidatus Bathyarchaeota archaeon]|nr:CBS domain-containing protein [Candidatus Bathyarchaeota archaeon]
MYDNNVSRLLVFDKNDKHKLVGILTRSDIMHFIRNLILKHSQLLKEGMPNEYSLIRLHLHINFHPYSFVDLVAL